MSNTLDAEEGEGHMRTFMVLGSSGVTCVVGLVSVRP
jgi:hypothetical protein